MYWVFIVPYMESSNRIVVCEMEDLEDGEAIRGIAADEIRAIYAMT